MSNKKETKCSIPECIDIACYGYNDDSNKAYWCKNHMLEMPQDTLFILIKSRQRDCRNENCTKDCSYNFPDKKKPIFCKDHYLVGMKNLLVTKICKNIIDEKQCTSIPSYGLIGGTSKDAIYCSKCVKTLPNKNEYEDVAHKKCLGSETEKCNLNPTFGYKGSKAEYCEKHSKEGMENVRDNKCIYKENDKDCEILASFGLIGTKKKIYCMNHSIVVGGCEDLAHKKCTFTDENNIKCEERARYGNSETKEVLFCKKHADTKISQLDSKMCIFIDNNNKCNERALFGYVNNKTRLYCTNHSKNFENLINYNVKKCIFELDGKKCTKDAKYNFIDQKEKTHCFEHKLNLMVDKSNPICIHKENGVQCTKIAFYNLKNKNKRLMCFEHKLENMVFKGNNHCLATIREDGERCTTRPIFNLPGNSKGLYCSLHKTEQMIDVINQKCIHTDENGVKCTLNPVFGDKNAKVRLYCSFHKPETAIDISKTLCTEKDCPEIAVYNFDYESRPKFCYRHKTDLMIHKHQRVCKTFMCNVFIDSEKYDGFCCRCYVIQNPDTELTTNYRTKELTVVQYLKDNFESINMMFNRQIEGGTSSRRPDVLIRTNDYNIIIEIDENQHTDYDCSCENKRIYELMEDLKYENTVFIRFNPDSYYDFNKKKINSCWDYNSRGRIFICDNMKIEWNSRLQILKDTVQYWLDNRPDKLIEVVQLFYDQNF